MLKRKIDTFLLQWKAQEGHKPLIVKGARQIGKTESISLFARTNYTHVVAINFALQPQYKHIFDNGYDVDVIKKNISLINPEIEFVDGDTLFFFDELQDCPTCATSLKSFHLDGRYDVICSGSLMGIYYKQIESNSVGFKEDYEMYSMDFEEFLWARGYKSEQIDSLFQRMVQVQALSDLEMEVMMEAMHDYMVVGGMPEVVNKYMTIGNFSGILSLQKQLLLDYEEDITKYAEGFDQARILSVYRHISTFLGKENKRFQISKLSHGARNREYMGAVEWLENAGIVNVCYCLENPELPLKGNYIPNQYKLYFRDTGLLIASLDEEAQDDLRQNRNFGTYKGAIYENIVGDMLYKQGYALYYYRNEKGTIEMDFFVRNHDSLIPVEVKANDGATVSLNRLVGAKKDRYDDILFGVKFCNKNIGFNGRFYTFPYFLGFLLKRWLSAKKE